MITAERMAAVDRNAEALGVSRRQLMESSGNAIAEVVRNSSDSGDTVTIVCGRGNNGGDGFVAARFLTAYDVSVRLVGRAETITTDLAKANWEALERSEIDYEEWRDSSEIALDTTDVIVDALVGTGVSGPLREPIASAVRAINEHEARVIGVDVPSGVDANSGEAAGPSVQADRVVTFHDEKPGLAALDISVTIADIGIPDAAELFVGPGDIESIDRDAHSHKGDAGRILVIGGGPYTGAPALSALAAMRAGADLGVVACPESIASVVQGYVPDLIVRPLSGDRIEEAHVDHLLALAERADCVVLGPGLGDHKESNTAVRQFLSAFTGRAVVDADALDVVPTLETKATLLCTPHQGELTDMGGPQESRWRDRMTAVQAYAESIDHTILLKGPYDVISDGTQTRVNRTGNPGMTVGGTGDVLAGACAAMLAESEREVIHAGAIGAYVTGAAGDWAASQNGYGLTASDVITGLPRIIWGETDE